MSKSIINCIECNQDYFQESSQMKELCPECAHTLYGYDNCKHEYKKGRCIKCNGKESFLIREASPNEFVQIGNLMVSAYSKLKDFPGKDEISAYYEYLQTIGSITVHNSVELLVAVSSENEIMGAVVFFKSMEKYGTDGIATLQKDASGFRLLAVDEKHAGKGVGKQLCLACIQKAKELNSQQVIIHSTKFMQVARKMYNKMGFQHSKDLDFTKGGVEVFGYRLYF